MWWNNVYCWEPFPTTRHGVCDGTMCIAESLFQQPDTACVMEQCVRACDTCLLFPLFLTGASHCAQPPRTTQCTRPDVCQRGDGSSKFGCGTKRHSVWWGCDARRWNRETLCWCTLHSGGVVSTPNVYGRVSSKAHSLETAHRLASPLLQGRTNWYVVCACAMHVWCMWGWVNRCELW